MAIGSDPEIGTEFSTWGKMSEQSRDTWFIHMVEHWGADLMGGYAKVCSPDPDRMSFYKENSWLFL